MKLDIDCEYSRGPWPYSGINRSNWIRSRGQKSLENKMISMMLFFPLSRYVLDGFHGDKIKWDATSKLVEKNWVVVHNVRKEARLK